jgi:PST family polysaccharide transporter
MLIGLLLAGPGVLATITFAPLVIMLFYSAKFGAAVAILRWICLGATLQVITWPMGFIIVAKNNRMLYFLVELSWAIFAVGSAYIGILLFGVTGAGIASFVACVFHAFLIYPIVHRLTGFQCSPENLQIGSIYCASIGVAFSGFFLFSFVTATLVATIVLLLNTTYSIRSLLRIVPLKDLPAPFRRIALICGLKRAEV